MNSLIALLGLVPNTSAILRVKFAIVGVGALMAGLIFMASGIDGSILRGGLIAACGVGLLSLAFREPKQRLKEEECAAPRNEQILVKEPWPVSSCDHDWVDQDEMSHHDPIHIRCSRCGEHRWG
jgi:hypothetical protein